MSCLKRTFTSRSVPLFYKQITQPELRLCLISHSTKASAKITESSKIEPKTNDNKRTPLSNEVIEYIKSKEGFKSMEIPKKLLRKKNALDNLYLTDKSIAGVIMEHISKYYDKSLSNHFLEANPGVGLLTEELLQADVKNLRVYESTKQFVSCLEELSKNYPGKLGIYNDDLFSMWKLAYQDRLDSGNRMDTLLQGMKPVEWGPRFSMTMAGVVSTGSFIKHLLHSLVLQYSILSYGRCEMYFIMSPAQYIHLTCDKTAGYQQYRATSIMFQICFEFKLLDKFPRRAFLPWRTETSKQKLRYNKVYKVDPDSLYLVRIVPRLDLYSLCPPERLQQLWYFVRHHCLSRRNRIVPHLEKWIPNCGVRLIANPDIREAPIASTYFNNKLDIVTVPESPPMKCDDYYPNMNVYTQFGDLNPSQMLTLFTQFSSWPEYEDSPFLASMESTLLRFEPVTEDAPENVPETEEEADIIDSEDEDNIKK